MKCINDRKKYDTETAKLVGSWSNGLSSSDFDYCCEKLYLKTTGEFFLYGEGGPGSEYAATCENRWKYGETIIPFAEDSARAWCEINLNADKYEAIFGAVDDAIAESVARKKELLRELKDIAARLGELRRTISWITS